MKSLYLSLGLIMAAHACAASTVGAISVSLTIIAPPCYIDGSTAEAAHASAAACGEQNAAQPKINEAVLASKTLTDEENRLITVEW